MFGPFKPSSALSGGLLWKIPWRMSAPQKLRQRRRLRRVDNVVAVLDTALQRQALSQQTLRPQLSQPSPAQEEETEISIHGATATDLSTTAEGQRFLASHSLPASQTARRHGKGPKQGDLLNTTQNPETTLGEPPRLLADEARAKGTTKLLERWKATMPTEQEMLPRDKYSMFDRKVRGYRKGVHKLPKWTRVSQRLNPPGF